jgi:alpha-D-ribose 1-methylphosphonate 5-triphosphate synthase subunit PhnI
VAYVAVKGGEQAIENAHAWLDEARRGDPALPALSVRQIEEQLSLAVDRVMAEGACTTDRSRRSPSSRRGAT